MLSRWLPDVARLGIRRGRFKPNTVHLIKIRSGSQIAASGSGPVGWLDELVFPPVSGSFPLLTGRCGWDWAASQWPTIHSDPVTLSRSPFGANRAGGRPTRPGAKGVA